MFFFWEFPQNLFLDIASEVIWNEFKISFRYSSSFFLGPNNFKSRISEKKFHKMPSILQEFLLEIHAKSWRNFSMNWGWNSSSDFYGTSSINSFEIFLQEFFLGFSLESICNLFGNFLQRFFQKFIQGFTQTFLRRFIRKFLRRFFREFSRFFRISLQISSEIFQGNAEKTPHRFPMYFFHGFFFETLQGYLWKILQWFFRNGFFMKFLQWLLKTIIVFGFIYK